MVTMLNIVCTMAMPKVLAVSLSKENQQRMQPVKTAQEHQRADDVKVQMNHCGALAFLLAPAEEISAVTVVPMFWPMMMGMALP